MSGRPPEGLSSRDRILWAAATMLGEGPGSALSVRAVATRAEVSTGSLRHHFPTQRQLLDAALAVVYDQVLSEEKIHDTSISPRERLMACMQRLLAPAGVGADARGAWIRMFEHYVAREPSSEAREEFFSIDREIRRRLEFYLSVLQKEGAVPAGDNAARVELLLSVLNGLSFAQVVPSEAPRAQAELGAVRLVVEYVVSVSGHGNG